MGSYVPGTKEEQQEMLQAIGLDSFDQLFEKIPKEVRVEKLDLPAGLPELSAAEKMEEIAGKNRVFRHIFRGAGAYNHYIPAIVRSVVTKENFVTAYTPYQAEISQGILQSIFEYQTLICRLTGMDVSNASVYDGATAAAEAAAMCCDRKRSVICIASTSHPSVISTVRTYAFGSGAEVILAPQKDGRTDAEKLKESLNGQTACLYVQQPNYYGQLEDCEALAGLAHEAGAKFIMGCNPIALGILKTPAECGADIAVGDGQPLGMPLAWGGPYLGFMAAKENLMRKLPGRIVGETKDDKGNRAFVLTLQAREQHIRREKASSNICSNQALCALTAAVYLSAMGDGGLKEAASQCYAKAHYLQKELAAAGLRPKYSGDFFHEFVTEGEVHSSVVLKWLEEKGILGGLPLSSRDILWCVTEKNTKEEMDDVVSAVKEVIRICS